MSLGINVICLSIYCASRSVRIYEHELPKSVSANIELGMMCKTQLEVKYGPHFVVLGAL